VIKSDALANLTNISHGFFTRRGGTSTGIYAGRNGGLGSDDLRAHVIENRGRTADDLHVPRHHLLTVHQIHSATGITATERWTPSDAPQGDALVNATPGIALGILDRRPHTYPLLRTPPMGSLVRPMQVGKAL